MRMLTAFVFTQVSLGAAAMPIPRDGRVPISETHSIHTHLPMLPPTQSTLVTVTTTGKETTTPTPHLQSRMNIDWQKIADNVLKDTHRAKPSIPRRFANIRAAPTPHLGSRMNIDWQKIAENVLKDTHRSKPSNTRQFANIPLAHTAVAAPHLRSRMNINWEKIADDVLKGTHKAKPGVTRPSAKISRAGADVTRNERPQAMIKATHHVNAQQRQSSRQGAMAQTSKDLSELLGEDDEQWQKIREDGIAEAAKAGSAGIAEAAKAGAVAVSDAAKAGSVAFSEAAKAGSAAMPEASKARFEAHSEAEKARLGVIPEAEQAKAEALGGDTLQKARVDALVEAEKAKAEVLEKLRSGSWWARRRNAKAASTTTA
ncbi:hypothetical protein MFIFM68171_01212 [Madurella fahalii]|uniref:Uncharacterized protein n=1 Tax=Madurella fahalii TaxID=1157608 RepID=A0ABQ0FZS5_9PEZI